MSLLAQGPSRAQLWLRVDREGSPPGLGLFDNMADRPVTSREWGVHEISGVVDGDAVVLNIGMMHFGSGAACLDGVLFEVLD